jgi:hypothetical protein
MNQTLISEVVEFINENSQSELVIAIGYPQNIYNPSAMVKTFADELNDRLVMDFQTGLSYIERSVELVRKDKDKEIQLHKQYDQRRQEKRDFTSDS